MMNDGDWVCPDEACGNINFSRRTSCNRCKKDRPDAKAHKKKLGTEIGKCAAEKSRGLFNADDWQCSKCANVNWARRTTCNVCNAPKFGEVEARTGYGGGYNERGVVEYRRRNHSSDEEYDEFGRKKRRRSPAGARSLSRDPDRDRDRPEQVGVTEARQCNKVPPTVPPRERTRHRNQFLQPTARNARDTNHEKGSLSDGSVCDYPPLTRSNLRAFSNSFNNKSRIPVGYPAPKQFRVHNAPLEMQDRRKRHSSGDQAPSSGYETGPAKRAKRDSVEGQPYYDPVMENRVSSTNCIVQANVGPEKSIPIEYTLAEKVAIAANAIVFSNCQIVASKFVKFFRKPAPDFKAIFELRQRFLTTGCLVDGHTEKTECKKETTTEKSSSVCASIRNCEDFSTKDTSRKKPIPNRLITKSHEEIAISSESDDEKEAETQISRPGSVLENYGAGSAETLVVGMDMKALDRRDSSESAAEERAPRSASQILPTASRCARSKSVDSVESNYPDTDSDGDKPLTKSRSVSQKTVSARNSQKKSSESDSDSFVSDGTDFFSRVYGTNRKSRRKLKKKIKEASVKARKFIDENAQSFPLARITEAKQHSKNFLIYEPKSILKPEENFAEEGCSNEYVPTKPGSTAKRNYQKFKDTVIKRGLNDGYWAKGNGVMIGNAKEDNAKPKFNENSAKFVCNLNIQNSTEPKKTFRQNAKSFTVNQADPRNRPRQNGAVSESAKNTDSRSTVEQLKQQSPEKCIFDTMESNIVGKNKSIMDIFGLNEPAAEPEKSLEEYTDIQKRYEMQWDEDDDALYKTDDNMEDTSSRLRTPTPPSIGSIQAHSPTDNSIGPKTKDRETLRKPKLEAIKQRKEELVNMLKDMREGNFITKPIHKSNESTLPKSEVVKDPAVVKELPIFSTKKSRKSRREVNPDTESPELRTDFEEMDSLPSRNVQSKSNGVSNDDKCHENSVYSDHSESSRVGNRINAKRDDYRSDDNFATPEPTINFKIPVETSRDLYGKQRNVDKIDGQSKKYKPDVSYDKIPDSYKREVQSESCKASGRYTDFSRDVSLSDVSESKRCENSTDNLRNAHSRSNDKCKNLNGVSTYLNEEVPQEYAMAEFDYSTYPVNTSSNEDSGDFYPPDISELPRPGKAINSCTENSEESFHPTSINRKKSQLEFSLESEACYNRFSENKTIGTNSRTGKGTDNFKDYSEDVSTRDFFESSKPANTFNPYPEITENRSESAWTGPGKKVIQDISSILKPSYRPAPANSNDFSDKGSPQDLKSIATRRPVDDRSMKLTIPPRQQYRQREYDAMPSIDEDKVTQFSHNTSNVPSFTTSSPVTYNSNMQMGPPQDLNMIGTRRPIADRGTNQKEKEVYDRQTFQEFESSAHANIASVVIQHNVQLPPAPSTPSPMKPRTRASEVSPRVPQGEAVAPAVSPRLPALQSPNKKPIQSSPAKETPTQMDLTQLSTLLASINTNTLALAIQNIQKLGQTHPQSQPMEFTEEDAQEEVSEDVDETRKSNDGDEWERESVHDNTQIEKELEKIDGPTRHVPYIGDMFDPGPDDAPQSVKHKLNLQPELPSLDGKEPAPVAVGSFKSFALPKPILLNRLKQLIPQKDEKVSKKTNGKRMKTKKKSKSGKPSGAAEGAGAGAEDEEESDEEADLSKYDLWGSDSEQPAADQPGKEKGEKEDKQAAEEGGSAQEQDEGESNGRARSPADKDRKAKRSRSRSSSSSSSSSTGSSRSSEKPRNKYDDFILHSEREGRHSSPDAPPKSASKSRSRSPRAAAAVAAARRKSRDSKSTGERGSERQRERDRERPRGREPERGRGAGRGRDARDERDRRYGHYPRGRQR